MICSISGTSPLGKDEVEDLLLVEKSGEGHGLHALKKRTGDHEQENLRTITQPHTNFILYLIQPSNQNFHFANYNPGQKKRATYQNIGFWAFLTNATRYGCIDFSSSFTPLVTYVHVPSHYQRFEVGFFSF